LIPMRINQRGGFAVSRGRAGQKVGTKPVEGIDSHVSEVRHGAPDHGVATFPRAAYGALGFFWEAFPGFHPGLTSCRPSGASKADGILGEGAGRDARATAG
jgi:hypothetical protein